MQDHQKLQCPQFTHRMARAGDSAVPCHPRAIRQTGVLAEEVRDIFCDVHSVAEATFGLEPSFVFCKKLQEGPAGPGSSALRPLIRDTRCLSSAGLVSSTIDLCLDNACASQVTLVVQQEPSLCIVGTPEALSGAPAAR